MVFDEGLDREQWLEIKVVSQILKDEEFKLRLKSNLTIFLECQKQ